MSDHTEHSIVINADVDAVMAVISDFPSYPRWVSAVSDVEVTIPGDAESGEKARQVRFTVDAGVLKDVYELRYAWAADGLSVSWDLVSSTLQKGQNGRYVLVQLAPGSTKVTYELTVDLLVPMIGVLKRRAERAITSAALGDLKKRVEA